jgi:superfamily II DNA or RNA helicase
MQFSGLWRDYQKRVLDGFEVHLKDKRLHVVAAPGSGKTILGLELLRRLGGPALVLAPTRTIRDQWLARLVPLFLSEPPRQGEVSRELDALAGMTTTTYQALHALWADRESDRFAKLLEGLQSFGPVTLVLDEAHHLRREWWNALQALTDALPDARLVALTATPPYDASFAEWSRYATLCGPIDLEIGVPELVRNGDLCPHQDHVFFSAPTQDALELLYRRRKGIASIQDALRSDAGLLDFLVDHPWLTDPRANAEAILEAPELLSSILVHLAVSGRKLPAAPLALLGVRRGEVPLPDAFWLEVLLNGLLFRLPDIFPIGEERGKGLRASLHEFGLIEGGEIRLTESHRIFTLMAGSLAKLDSIATIVKAEADSLGAGLRMVVLSDHVRAGELPRAATEAYIPTKLGVVPVFETLRRAAIEGQSLGVLTGSLVVIPREAEAPLREISAQGGIPPAEMQLADIPGCPGHLRLSASGEGARRAVELVTALFTAGHVTILVGTQALLGEGWDAPVINSVVLATNSAAFMLSNQMRGRAIRIDPEKSDKVANIWHLATVEQLPASPIETWGERLNWGKLDNGESVTSDLDLLQRRFRAFEGISNFGSLQIESGLARLGLSGAEGLESCNTRTLAVARNRPALAKAWQISLGDASQRAHLRETASPNYAPRGLSWYDTLQWLGASALSGGTFAAANELRHISGMARVGALSMALAGSAALVALPKLAKAGWLLYRNGSLEGSLGQVGRVVMAGLHRAEIVSDEELASAWFEVRCTLSGRRDVLLHGASRASERAVMEAMAEILAPIQNPRYLLVRRSLFGFVGRADYHAVPSAIARKKEWAEHFHDVWKAHVGSSRLVFTRTPKGRMALLRARARSFAAGFQRRIDRRSAWS